MRRGLQLHEAGLQLGLKGGDGRAMIAASRDQIARVSSSGWCAAIRGGWRHRPATVRMALWACENPLPDPVGRGIAQSALEITEGFQLIAGGQGLFEKGPQGVGGQQQTAGSCRRPDAEGASTAGRPSSIVAEHPPCANGSLILMRLVVTAEETHVGSGSLRPCNAGRPSSSAWLEPLPIPLAFRRPARPQPAPPASRPRRAIIGSADEAIANQEGGGVQCRSTRGGVARLQRLRKRGCWSRACGRRPIARITGVINRLS